MKMGIMTCVVAFSNIMDIHLGTQCMKGSRNLVGKKDVDLKQTSDLSVAVSHLPY